MGFFNIKISKMKSIKKFTDKKIENMSNLQGGDKITKKATYSNRDRRDENDTLITNSSWFRPSDLRP